MSVSTPMSTSNSELVLVMPPPPADLTPARERSATGSSDVSTAGCKVLYRSDKGEYLYNSITDPKYGKIGRTTIILRDLEVFIIPPSMMEATVYMKEDKFILCSIVIKNYMLNNYMDLIRPINTKPRNVPKKHCTVIYCQNPTKADVDNIKDVYDLAVEFVSTSRHLLIKSLNSTEVHLKGEFRDFYKSIRNQYAELFRDDSSKPCHMSF